MSMTSERFIVNSQGEKTAVILPMHHYEQLLGGSKALSVAAKRRKVRNNHPSRIKKSEIKKMVFQLPQQDLVELFEELESRMETFEMMRMAESAFAEWLEPEEDIYDEE